MYVGGKCTISKPCEVEEGIKENETALKRTNHELDLYIFFPLEKNKSKMGKMRLFHMVLVVMQIASLYSYVQHIWLPCGFAL